LFVARNLDSVIPEKRKGRHGEEGVVVRGGYCYDK
jgi:hypothetical protein